MTNNKHGKHMRTYRKNLLGLIAGIVTLSTSLEAQTVTGTLINVGTGNSFTPNFNGIASGAYNTNAAGVGFIGGGIQNGVVLNAGTQTNGYGSSILGGNYNRIETPFSAIGGGIANRLLATNTLPTSPYDQNESKYSVIAGGTYNTSFGGANAIGGGLRNITEGWVNYSVISGGADNRIGYASGYSTISGGTENVIEDGAWWAAINGGQGNEIEGPLDAYPPGQKWTGESMFPQTEFFHYGWIGGGHLNYITSRGYVGSIGGGEGNVVDATAATVAGGRQANASNYGQQAYASGAFATPGDAQGSTFILRRATTSSATTEMFLDGGVSQMLIPVGGTWTFEILVSARSTTGNSAGYRFLGVIENNGGTTAIVGAVSKTNVAEDIASWDVTVSADNTNDALVVKVNGDATNVRWVATVRTSEVRQ